MNKLIGTGIAAILATAMPFAAFAATDNLAPTPETHTVTIALYVDGAHATASSTSGISFPMRAQWGAKNIGYGTGDYALSTTGFNTAAAYEAVTSPMSLGAHYSTRELISWQKNNVDGANVSGDCRTGDPFVLEGYSIGSSMAAAQAAGPTKMNWDTTTNLTSDTSMIVWIRHCLTAPAAVSPKNGTATTSAALTKIDWNDVSSSWGTVSYYYEVSNSPTLKSDGSYQTPVYQSGALSTSEIATPGTPAAIYYWHVMAKDSAGNSSPWSNSSKVTVTP